MFKPDLTVGFVLFCLLGLSSQESCIKVSFDNDSSPDLTGTVQFQFSTPVSAWTLILTLDKWFQEFRFPQGVVSRKGKVVTIKSTGDNGNQPAGADITSTFSITHTNRKPRILSAKLLVETCNTFSIVDTITPVTTTTTTTTSATCTTTTTTAATTTTTSTPTTSSIKPCQTSTKYDYDQAICFSNLFYQAQRSGDLDVLGDFNHGMVPYRGNSAMNDGSDNGVDLVGGYYDAGDYVKFNFPLASATTLLAWGAIDFKAGYEAAGEYTNTLNTIKWATDYFIKCHTATNELWAQVGDGYADHSVWTRIEEKAVNRPSHKIDQNNPGSDLAGETAAALAAASIVFKDVDLAYSTKLLKHARELFNFADKYRGKYSDSVPAAADFYRSWSGFEDELVWSAAWLYKATGEQSYLLRASQLYVDKSVTELSWDEKTAGAQILLSQLTGEEKYIGKARSFCDNMADSQTKTQKGLVWIQQWGSLRHASNVAFACLEAANIDHPSINSDKYRSFAMNQIHYALGDTGRSFVVGYGNNPPTHPHHASSSCPIDINQKCDWENFNNPGPNPSTLWGALVGGPGQDDSYNDNRGDYVKNEVATDYNAGFQSALAALRTLAGTTCA